MTAAMLFAVWEVHGRRHGAHKEQNEADERCRRCAAMLGLTSATPRSAHADWRLQSLWNGEGLAP